MDINKISQDLIRDEGLRLRPYRDSVGKLTIGVGRNIDDRPLEPMFAQYVNGDGSISRELALDILAYDIDVASNELFSALPWVLDLDEVRQRVLINMSFNMGMPVLKQFKNTLIMIEQGDYKSAAKNMLLSKWAKQVGARALRLAKMMETGEDV